MANGHGDPSFHAWFTMVNDRKFAVKLELTPKDAVSGLEPVTVIKTYDPSYVIRNGTPPSNGNQTPGRPSSVIADGLTAKRIELEWLDNAANETSIRLERRRGTSGSWSEIAILSAEHDQLHRQRAVERYGVRVPASRTSRRAPIRTTPTSRGHAPWISCSSATSGPNDDGRARPTGRWRLARTSSLARGAARRRSQADQSSGRSPAGAILTIFGWKRAIGSTRSDWAAITSSMFL